MNGVWRGPGTTLRRAEQIIVHEEGRLTARGRLDDRPAQREVKRRLRHSEDAMVSGNGEGHASGNNGALARR